MLNPEFRRYLWTELSPHKLVAMPVVLGAAFALAEVSGAGLAMPASIGFTLIVCFWGTRNAAAAVTGEVTGGTWDSQRLSALDAWTMAWGKLFGSTIFAWYGGLICLAVYAADSVGQVSLAAIGKFCLGLVLVAVLMHATALAASLAFLRKLSGTRQVSVTLCHLIGLGVFAVASREEQFADMLLRGVVRPVPLQIWHGVGADAYAFMAITLLLFLGWAMLAVHRLMGAELQYRLWPWGWAAFSLFMVAFLSGYGDVGGGWAAPINLLGISFAVFSAATYLAFLLENKNIVAAKAWIEALTRRQWAAVARLTPSWLVCLCLSVAAGIVLAGISSLGLIGTRISAGLPYWVTSSGPFIVAAILFMLRDLGILLFLNLATGVRRPDAVGMIYLTVLYGVGGGILSRFEVSWPLAFVIPMDLDNPFATLTPPLVQGLAIYALLATRLRGLLHREA